MTVNSISWWFHFQWRYTKRTPVDGTARYNNHRAPLMTPVLNLIFTGCSTLLAQYQINMRLVNSWYFQNAWRTIMQRRLLTLSSIHWCNEFDSHSVALCQINLNLASTRMSQKFCKILQAEKWTQVKIKPLKYANCKPYRKVRSCHPRQKVLSWIWQ